jgi:hypothetical protein
MQSPVTLAAARAHNFGTTSKLLSGHEDETYEEFSARYAPNRQPLMSESVGRGGRSAVHRDVRRFPEQTSGFTWG